MRRRKKNILREVAVGNAAAHLCLTPIVKELKIGFEHGSVVTTLNITNTRNILVSVATPPFSNLGPQFTNLLLRVTKNGVLHQHWLSSVSGEFLGIVGEDLSDSKSNRLHVDIF